MSFDVSENNGQWPAKHRVLGVNVSATDYDGALAAVVAAARDDRAACVSHLAVHGLVTGSQEPEFQAMLEDFDIVAPDGQPVRWALNMLYRADLGDRCYGPEFMLRVCERAAAEGLSVYLYGSEPHVVKGLARSLVERFPKLRVVGAEPSVFRPLTPQEDADLVERVRASGADFFFVGLGCPRQERFAWEHRDSIPAVQICVGAAFDFISGNKTMAPAWMQRLSLEWLYRLLQEPRRLARRYFVTNTIFVWKLARQAAGRQKAEHRPAGPIARENDASSSYR